MAVLLGVAGPFGTFDRVDFPARFRYWLAVCGSGLCVALAVKAFVAATVPVSNAVGREAIVILLTTAVFTPVLSALSVWAYPGFDGALPNIWHLASLVLCICVALSVMVNGIPMLLLEERTALNDAAQVRLARRLPDGFDGKILRLYAENHMVVVVTSAGTFRVRMRFADAVGEMTGVVGYSTHRSHWVAADAIERAEKQAGKHVVRTRDGAAVPVSRTYRAALERAELI